MTTAVVNAVDSSDKLHLNHSIAQNTPKSRIQNFLNMEINIRKANI